MHYGNITIIICYFAKNVLNSGCEVLIYKEIFRSNLFAIQHKNIV